MVTRRGRGSIEADDGRREMSIDMSHPIKFLRTMKLSDYDIPSDFMLDMHEQLDKLEREIQETKARLIGVTEQLEIAEVVLSVQVTASALAYFKDKQGGRNS